MENRDFFQLIDLDRYILNTPLFVKKIREIVDDYKPGLGKTIDQLYEQAYQREESFFALEYIRQTLGQERYKAFSEEAKQRIQEEELLLPGAKQRLELAASLTDRDPGYGILTYSLYPEDQYLKMKLAGLDHIPMYISNTPNKSELLTSWQTEDGDFQLPEEFGGQRVESLTLEDDKLRAFFDLPENVTGVWLTSREDAIQQIAQLGLRNLVTVKHLDESSEFLRSKFSS